MIKKIWEDLYQIDKIFPEKICKKILNIFQKEKKWKFINQVRNKHYNHVFRPEQNLNKSLFSSKQETYYTKFYRNEKLKKNNFIIKNIIRYIFPILKN